MAEKYTEEDSSLTPAHVKTLQRCHSEIVENVNVSNIIDTCYGKEIITTLMKEEILKREKTSTQSCREFLDMLETLSIKAFNTFVEILETDYDFIAKTIKNNLREQAIHHSVIILRLAVDTVPIDPLSEYEFRNTKEMVMQIREMMKHLMEGYNLDDTILDKQITTDNDMAEDSLTPAHEKTLKICHSEIIHNVKVQFIIDACYRDDIITRPMKEDILKQEKTSIESCRELLDKLSATRSKKAFNNFVKILSENGYGVRAKMIKKNLREQAINQAKIALMLANDTVPIEPLGKSELKTTTQIVKQIRDITRQLMDGYNVNGSKSKTAESGLKPYQVPDPTNLYTGKMRSLTGSSKDQVEVSTMADVDMSYKRQVQTEPNDNIACQLKLSTEPDVDRNQVQAVKTGPNLDELCKVQAPTVQGTEEVWQIIRHQESSVCKVYQITEMDPNVESLQVPAEGVEALSLLNPTTAVSVDPRQKSSVQDVPEVLQEWIVDKTLFTKIYSLTILSTGDYVMTGKDSVYRKALLLDDRMNRKKTLEAYYAWCVASSKDVFAVSCQSDGSLIWRGTAKVKLFDVKGIQLKEITAPTILNPRAIAFNLEQELICTDENKKTISFINTLTGKTFTTNGGMFKTTNSIAVIDKDTIIIADWEDKAVKIISRRGKLLRCYTGDGDNTLKGPVSVCVDSAGHIIIADNEANNIQLLSPEGNFKKIIVSKNHGVLAPFAVALNKQGDIVIGTAKSAKPADPAKVYVVKYMT